MTSKGIIRLVLIPAILALAACNGTSPAPVDDGATLVPTSTASPVQPTWTPPPTDFTTPLPDPAIAEIVGRHLQGQRLAFAGWCTEVPEGTRDAWCADRPEPQEGILVVRVGPVFSEYVYDIYVGFGDNESYVITGQGPVTDRVIPIR